MGKYVGNKTDGCCYFVLFLLTITHPECRLKVFFLSDTEKKKGARNANLSILFNTGLAGSFGRLFSNNENNKCFCIFLIKNIQSLK